MSKSQVFVAHNVWVICRNVSRTFVELCMETPYWCTVLVHQYSGRKSTKTSGVHFATGLENCTNWLIFEQCVQLSGLCGPQFVSYLPKRFRHLCRALYGDAILVHSFGAPIWPPKINKNIWSSLFLQKLLLFTRDLAYVRIEISSNTWNGYTAENQEEIVFFNETAFLFWFHALWKLGSSNICNLEMKHATGMKTCKKIYFLFIFT